MEYEYVVLKRRIRKSDTWGSFLFILMIILAGMALLQYSGEQKLETRPNGEIIIEGQ